MRSIMTACCLLCACVPVDEQNLGFSAVGAPRWAMTFGGLYNDAGLAVAIDSIGDAVAVGYTLGAPNSQGIQPATGFVTKRAASDGSERWTILFGPTTPQSGVNVSSVAIDGEDSVVITGNYVGTVDFGGQQLVAGSGDMFLARYSSDGHLQWVHGLNPTSGASGCGLAIDSVGRIVVAGTFGGSLVFGGTTYTESDGDIDMFLAAFDPAGALLWGEAFQSIGARPVGVAVDSSDSVLLTGTIAAPASFGGAILDPAGSYRAFLARYRKDGLYVSSQVLGAAGPGQSNATQVATDHSDHVIVQTNEQADGNYRTYAYGVVHVLDVDDQELWSAELVDHGDVSPLHRTLATAPSGLIVSSAWTDSPYNADHRDQVTGSMEVVAYDPSGHGTTSSFGTRLLGGLWETSAVGSTVGSTGTVAYIGSFAGAVDFGTGPMHSQSQNENDTDDFIVLLDPPTRAVPN